ncbi:MAG: hypothetical protein II098_03480 [Treponema sp.]|nr:hypothetical protein [Treponema sp.]
MSKKNMNFMNLILAVGLGLIFLGFVLILCFAGSLPPFSSLILPDGLFIAGFANLYYFLAFKKSPFRLFLSISLSMCGVFASLLVYGVLPLSIKELWPLFIIITSAALFVSGRYNGGSFAISYDFPAVALFILGGLYLLFSLGIIKVPFKTLALMSCPIVLIAAGLFLIILFLRRKALLEILPEEISDAFNKDEEDEDCE